jgi:hypothetical protein
MEPFKVKNGLVVNTNLIFANNGQVGINNTTPDANLTITGTANISGNTTVGSRLVVGNSTVNASINSTVLTISSANISGDVQITGALTVTGGVTSVAVATGAIIADGNSTVNATVQTAVTDGNARLEIGGTNNAYIDLKVPNSDDWDLRILANTTSAYMSSLGNLQFSANIMTLNANTVVIGGLRAFTNGVVTVTACTSPGAITNFDAGSGLIKAGAYEVGGDGSYIGFNTYYNGSNWTTRSGANGVFLRFNGTAFEFYHSQGSGVAGSTSTVTNYFTSGRTTLTTTANLVANSITGFNGTLTGTLAVTGNTTITGNGFINGYLAVNGSVIYLEGTVPQMRFHDTSITSGGGKYWWNYVDGDVYYILRDSDADGVWNTPHPFTLNGATSGGQLWGQTIWTAGNDGSGSGLDADTVDSIQASQFLRGDTTATHNEGSVLRKSSATANAAALSSATDHLEIYNSNNTTGDAYITFHNASRYAAFFGLDGATSQPFWGGWSAGAVKYKMWHAGNDGSGSGLDADLFDGLESSYFVNATNIALGTLSDARLPSTMSGKTFSSGIAVSGSVTTTSEYFRVTGIGGLYFNTYGGGWTMSDSTYIRSFGDKAMAIGSALYQADGNIYMPWAGAYLNTYFALKANVANPEFTGSLAVNNASGYASIEIGGSSGALIDFKSPATDDYDVRLNYTAPYLYVQGASAVFQNNVLISATNALQFSSYGGGWYMADTTFIRAYADKSIYTGGDIICIGTVSGSTGLATTGSMNAQNATVIDTLTANTVAAVNVTTTNNVTSSNNVIATNGFLVGSSVVPHNGMSADTIGQYAFLVPSGSSAYAVNATLAGSSLFVSDSAGNAGSAVSGTWRLLGRIASGGTKSSLWQRIA